MTGLLRASARALPHRQVALHPAAALVLLAVSLPALSGEQALLVLRVVAVLLAAGLALAVDEPGAQLLDVTPTSLRHRVAARTVLAAGLVLPAWVLALAVAASRGAQVPVATLTVELAALVAVGLAVPLCLRRWWGLSEPAVVVGPVLLAGLLGAAHLPPASALLLSAADPAWGAAHVRWALVLVAAVAVLAVAAGDPATARPRRSLRPGGAPAPRGPRARR